MRQVKEVQTIRDNRPIFILMMLTLGLPLMSAVIPFFTNEELNSKDLMGMALVPIVLAITLLLLLKMKTELIIKSDKITYRFNPFIIKQKEVLLKEISSWAIENHKWINGLGYRLTMNGGSIYVMSPGKVLAITTKDGRKYRFGINRPALVKRFIVENWEQKDTVYG